MQTDLSQMLLVECQTRCSLKFLHPILYSSKDVIKKHHIWMLCSNLF